MGVSNSRWLVRRTQTAMLVVVAILTILCCLVAVDRD
jgi:hypothetical protein